MSNIILMTGVGSYLPKNKFSNHDLTKFIDTSDEWITKRSGIKYRHFVSKNELTSDLATNAAFKAIKNAKINNLFAALPSGCSEGAKDIWKVLVRDH